MTRPILVRESSLEPKRPDMAEEIWVLVLSMVKWLALVVITPVHLVGFILARVIQKIHSVMTTFYHAIHAWQPRRPEIFAPGRDR